MKVIAFDELFSEHARIEQLTFSRSSNARMIRIMYQ